MEQSSQITTTIKYQKKILNIFAPKEDSQYICLTVILIDSIFRTGKNYYPQVFLEECKYVVKEKKVPSILLMI